MGGVRHGGRSLAHTCMRQTKYLGWCNCFRLSERFTEVKIKRRLRVDGQLAEAN